jgi:DNA-directed RNA polymerase sigma subunit (sigma70/sigma32)
LTTAYTRNREEGGSMARATKKPQRNTEVGQQFNVTRERIHQIEANVLARLRDPSRDLKIKAWFAKNSPPGT